MRSSKGVGRIESSSHIHTLHRRLHDALNLGTRSVFSLLQRHNSLAVVRFVLFYVLSAEHVDVLQNWLTCQWITVAELFFWICLEFRKLILFGFKVDWNNNFFVLFLSSTVIISPVGCLFSKVALKTVQEKTSKPWNTMLCASFTWLTVWNCHRRNLFKCCNFTRLISLCTP